MTKILKRPLSVLLAVLMIAGIFAALPLTAYAANNLTIEIMDDLENMDDHEWGYQLYDGDVSIAEGTYVQINMGTWHTDVMKIYMNGEVVYTKPSGSLYKDDVYHFTAGKNCKILGGNQNMFDWYTNPNVYITQDPPHTHNFSYTADGATITASCGEGCDVTTGLTLSISAPTGDLVADGTKTFPAILSTGYNTTAFPEGSISDISYTKDGQPYNGTPTEAGAYTASVTVGTATASVSYTVAAAEPDNSTTVSYDVQPTYTVAIPASVTLSDADVTADITASDVLLENGSQITVKLTAASNTASGSTFNAKNGDSTVAYTITADSAVAVGDTVATFTADGSKTLTFSAADKSAATTAGEHTETLTFTISA